MGKEIGLYPNKDVMKTVMKSNALLLTLSSMNESQNKYAEWEKLGQRKYMLYDSLHGILENSN